MARFSSEPQLRQIDLRKAQRKRVMLSAHCRTNTGRSGDVVIVDLTGDGCCMFTKALAVSVGLRVRVRPHGLESLPGVVRWVAKGYAGIEFDRPLYGPIADHLQRAFSAY